MDLDEMKRDGRWDVKPKKEQSRMEKIYKKLYKNLWGMRNLKKIPGVVIVIDAVYEDIAILEAQKLGIPIVAVVDTNANPEEVTFPVPGNDDAIRSIKLFVGKFCEAVQDGLQRRISESLEAEKNEAKAEASSEPVAETESTIEEK